MNEKKLQPNTFNIEGFYDNIDIPKIEKKY